MQDRRIAGSQDRVRRRAPRRHRDPAGRLTLVIAGKARDSVSGLLWELTLGTRHADIGARDCAVAMYIRQIDQVFWFPRRNCIVVTYRDGSPERMKATKSTAAMLAEVAGLDLVATRPGIGRWVRNPESNAHLEPFH
jgi:hypothetical protein